MISRERSNLETFWFIVTIYGKNSEYQFHNWARWLVRASSVALLITQISYNWLMIYHIDVIFLYYQKSRENCLARTITTPGYRTVLDELRNTPVRFQVS